MDGVEKTEGNTKKPAELDIVKTKKKAKEMINHGKGMKLQHSSKRRDKRRSSKEVAEQRALNLLRLSGMDEYGNAIKMNLLSKSGLTDNKVVRDLNILEDSIKEAARHIGAEDLREELDRHFGLDKLKDKDKSKQADGCTIAALLMMNAAMLHQRIANGQWLSGVSSLKDIKNKPNVVSQIRREWNKIRSHDFRPVLEPAIKAIEAVEDTGKLAGLERALRHIAAEAERIAETYADMGADHAGPLFNKVMGNQASDGAYFTRPVAASIAARLTLDLCGDLDWTSPEVWRHHKTVDLACGSGTLLTAALTDMKRRARDQGANEREIAELQKLAVEETIKGLDINPVSLQLAASQLTAGNHEIRYRRMGLYQMPYGLESNNSSEVSAGTLELLMQSAIIPKDVSLNLSGNLDTAVKSKNIWSEPDNTELEDAVDAVKNSQVVIMNPPFSPRKKAGEKFSDNIKKALHSRIDITEKNLVQNDEEMKKFVHKNTSIGPLFVALADRCVNKNNGIVTMIRSTVALTNISGEQERKLLAQRYQIHTILTCHQPKNYNLAQDSKKNESIIVIQRNNDSNRLPTRFIQLDKLPINEIEVHSLHESIINCQDGRMSNGWGEISYWPAERIETGDWTPAIWRSTKLAKVSAKFASDKNLHAIKDIPGLRIWSIYPTVYRDFKRSERKMSGSFPIIASAGGEGNDEGQTTIKSNPDEYWIPKKYDEQQSRSNSGIHPVTEKALSKAGYLLVAKAQDNRSARLTAVASIEKYISTGYLPVTGLTSDQAKAVAVFINSIPGRLQLMRNLAQKLIFPLYNSGAYGSIRIPNIKDNRICTILAGCWERTQDIEVPQFRDGECEVRRLWDEAVAEAMNWDPTELEELRLLLHQEPHVCEMGYNEYID